MSTQNEAPDAGKAISHYAVIVVDDEQNILQSLKRCFRREPFRLLCAGSGDEGLKLIAETPHVAVIISDQRMPGMNGSEFLTRSRELAPDAIRILLTGYSDNESTVAAMNEGGATHYIVKQKPWDDAELLHKVQKCVWEYHRVVSDRTLHLSNQFRNALVEHNFSGLNIMFPSACPCPFYCMLQPLLFTLQCHLSVFKFFFNQQAAGA